MKIISNNICKLIIILYHYININLKILYYISFFSFRGNNFKIILWKIFLDYNEYSRRVFFNNYLNIYRIFFYFVFLPKMPLLIKN